MPKRKVIGNLVLLFTFVGVAVGTIHIVQTIRHREVVLTTSSPASTYTVTLAGQRDQPKVLWLSHEVRFSVSKSKGAKESLTNKYLHFGDGFDPSFDHLYPQHKWVQENVLQLYNEEFLNDAERDNIVVQNKTDKVIEYLRVTSTDTFLLFDIQPGATFTLVDSDARSDTRWINVQGEFPERRKIKETGTNFLFPKGAKGPFTYFISINSDGLTIESPGLEKY